MFAPLISRFLFVSVELRQEKINARLSPTEQKTLGNIRELQGEYISTNRQLPKDGQAVLMVGHIKN